ncbi:MAG: RND transporter, partial [Candidatus Auribacterota bacterium]|nr:RND transporter [Candidatus Auribacterota bacterium]
MKIGDTVVSFAINKPKTVTWVMVFLTLLLALLAALPSIWPEAFSFLAPLKVDTDPENMLPEDEAVRIFHSQMKEEMTLYDMVVLGVVNDSNREGVFNPESLAKIYELTEYARTLRWPDEENPGKFKGVIEADIIAPSTVDNIAQAGPGTVEFEWLMATPPKTKEEALEVRKKAERIPFLKDTLVSHDGKALCIYLPLTAKDQSYRVYSHLKEKIATFDGEERYFVTGLPVAEDTFGVEMFKQMAISAPL